MEREERSSHYSINYHHLPTSNLDARTPTANSYGNTTFITRGETLSLDHPQKSSDTSTETNATWLPYNLRLCFIWIPTTLSFALGLAIILLYQQSQKHNGLSPENSSFGWKFVPTLLAVIYTQLTTMLFDDVKRTEPFARLSGHGMNIPPASSTILQRPKAWWTTLAHGFSKKRNGGKRSWTVILACVLNVIAFLMLSPLSAALFGVETTRRTQSVTMAKMVPSNKSTVNILADRDTMFRTTGALFQNVTTSPWISENYLVLPFGSPDTRRLPWDDHRGSVPQILEADTLVFRHDLQCEKLEVANKDFYVKAQEEGFANVDYLASVLLQSSGGCQYNLTFDLSTISDEKNGLASWAPLDRIAKHSFYMEDVRPIPSDKCRGDQVILASTPWINEDLDGLRNDLDMLGYICSSSHTMANMSVKATVSASRTVIDFDKNTFSNNKQPIPETLLNLTQLQDIYLNPAWYSYIPAQGTFGGAAALLGASYNLNMTRMIGDAGLPERAAYMQRRLFAEVLRTSLSRPQASQENQIEGKRTMIERRVTVNVEVAYILCALFFLSSIMLMGVIWLSRLARRPLNLTRDPSTVLGLASMITSDPAELSTFKKLDQSSPRVLDKALSCRTYTTSPGRLFEVESRLQNPEPPSELPPKTWKPLVLRYRTLFTLGIYLVLFIISITVLYTFANRSNLHQALFTYRTNLEVLGRLGSFAPFSIIPTFLAIILGLWWDGMDKSCRSLQPLVSTLKGPRKISESAGRSYESSYWLWAAVKAARNRDWLLSLITIGTFLSQAFIISMSALFEQDIGTISSTLNITRALELRQIPHVRQVVATDSPSFDDLIGSVLQDVFTNFSTNWMHSAIIQASSNGSDPVWSKDGWAFIPLDLSGIHSDSKKGSVGGNGDNEEFDDFSPIVSAQNITLRTPAIRGRVECSMINYDEKNSSTWLDNVNVTNGIQLDGRNITNVYLPLPVAFENTNLSAPFTAQSAYLSCCSNHTGEDTDPQLESNSTNKANNAMSISLGSWTSNFLADPTSNNHSVAGTTSNFTVKWVHDDNAGFGDLSRAVTFPASRDLLFFTQPPKNRVLNCMPVIETSEAEVTVENESGLVVWSRLVRSPESEIAAWSNAFVRRSSMARAKGGNNGTVDEEAGDEMQDVTISYGVLFFHTLLHAASLNILSLQRPGRAPIYDDYMDDMVFNIRNNQTGLNLDLMSYASYMQAGQDSTALLDEEQLLKHTQKTFSMFFQHYVSSGVSLRDGGWAYQPIGAQLDGVGPPTADTVAQIMPGGQLVDAYSTKNAQVQSTDPVANATVSTRVEILRMNEVALWVSVGILAWLTLTVVVFTAMQKWYLGDMLRNLECIADILVLVAGSHRLLGAIRDQGVEALLQDGNAYCRLGWFVDDEGKSRWGLEMAENAVKKEQEKIVNGAVGSTRSSGSSSIMLVSPVSGVQEGAETWAHHGRSRSISD